MRISVIIPTYNSQQFVGEALQSVYAQRTPVYEIICVDDASEDKTPAIIRSEFPDVTLLQNIQNAGPSFSRNKGLSIATGDFIAFLDADDCWLPGSMTVLSQEFLSNSLLELVAGMTEPFVTEGSESNVQQQSEKPHFNSYLSSMLIKKSLFEKIGTFDNSMRLSEDHDWFLRAREKGIVMNISNALVLRKRIHSANTTHKLTTAQSGIIQALKNSLDRRRDQNNLTDLSPLNHSIHD